MVWCVGKLMAKKKKKTAGSREEKKTTTTKTATFLSFYRKFPSARFSHKVTDNIGWRCGEKHDK